MASNTQAAPNAHKTGGNNAPVSIGRKENILDLDKYIDHSVCVKFRGGRQVHGTLKGYDQLVNLVLDECTEYLREENDSYRLSDKTRSIGLVVCRGTTVMLISPVDGTEEIANPFIQQDE